MRAMTAYDWPGNIRQLQNFIERCVIESEDRVFEVPLNELRMCETSTSRKNRVNAGRRHAQSHHKNASSSELGR